MHTMFVNFYIPKKRAHISMNSFYFLMVPRKRLELLHLAATASKTVMSTIPSPGQLPNKEELRGV